MDLRREREKAQRRRDGADTSRTPIGLPIEESGRAFFEPMDQPVLEGIDESIGHARGVGLSRQESSESMLDEYGYADELEEFMAADRDPIEADPRFRDELREQLWEMLQAELFARPRDH